MNAVTIGEEPPEDAQWWRMYVRWPSGKRETIRTRFPAMVAMDRCVIRAIMPEPAVRVVAHESWPPR